MINFGIFTFQSLKFHGITKLVLGLILLQNHTDPCYLIQTKNKKNRPKLPLAQHNSQPTPISNKTPRSTFDPSQPRSNPPFPLQYHFPAIPLSTPLFHTTCLCYHHPYPPITLPNNLSPPPYPTLPLACKHRSQLHITTFSRQK